MRTVEERGKVQAGQVVHKFEAAGLGPAPYQFLGCEEKEIRYPDGRTQAAGTCQFCGHGIRWCYWLRATDGRTFYVGSDCIAAAGDSGLRRVVTQQEAARRRAKADERAARARGAAWAVWTEVVLGTVAEQAQDRMRALPHPGGFVDRVTGEPLTRWDWACWMMGNAGTSGMCSTAAWIETNVLEPIRAEAAA